MKRILIALIFLAGFSTAINAQTESPIVQEMGKKISGTYTVRNDTLRPIFLVIETVATSYDVQGQHFHSLDPSIHIQLSETSVRLSPQETHELSFKGKCDTLPCTFAFMNEMVVGHTQGNATTPAVAIRLVLPEVVYACSNAKNCRKNILTQAGLLPTLTAQK